MRRFSEGKLEEVIQILREEMITMGTDVANAKTGQMWAFDAERLAKRICPLLPKPNYDNLLSIEKARESVPNEDCSGHKHTEDEKEDIARYMQFGAEIQLTIDTDNFTKPKSNEAVEGMKALLKIKAEERAKTLWDVIHLLQEKDDRYGEELVKAFEKGEILK